MAAAIGTRLLLLGALALFEPVNAYQIRRELLSWEIEEWAHIKPGSIYSGLATLTRQGHAIRHDLPDGDRSVAVYQLAKSGRVEFERLVKGAIETVDLMAPLPFHAGFSLLLLIRRDDFAEMLRTRIGNLEQLAADSERASAELASTSTAPPHIVRGADLWSRLARAELSWATELLAAIQEGDLQFAGEPMAWEPAPDDPSWQMAADRERYQRLLGLT